MNKDDDVFASPRWLNDTGDVTTSEVYFFKMYRLMGDAPKDPAERKRYEEWLKNNVQKDTEGG